MRGEMMDRRDTERRDAGKKGCRKEGMPERRDEGKEGYRKLGMKERRDAGKKK